MKTSTLLWQRTSAVPVFCRIVEKFTLLHAFYHVIIIFLNPMPRKQRQHLLVPFCLFCFHIPK